MADVESVRVRVGTWELSGLAAEPDGPPRASILALHGGGMRASYFHGSAHPTLSLLSLGARLGYRVLALDRPGYGSSKGAGLPGASIADQASLVLDALDTLIETERPGAGWGVVGHSYGMKVGLAMAASERGARLLGLDCSGAGVHFNPAAVAHLGTSSSHTRRELNWGPDHLYPPNTFRRGSIELAEVPDVESKEAPRWPDEIVKLAPRVEIPVRYTVADHERWWDVSPEALQAFRALFVKAARVEIDFQPFAGHNISLGYAARPYHLRALAFIEECAAGRTTASELNRKPIGSEDTVPS